MIANNERHQALPILESLIDSFPETITLAAGDDAPLLYLLTLLVVDYPSQRSFLSASRNLRSGHLVSPNTLSFIDGVASSIRRSEFSTLSRLLSPQHTASIFSIRRAPPNPNNFFLDSVQCTLGRLRRKTRESSWLVVRAAYREISCQPTTSGGNGSGPWLARILLLEDPGHAVSNDENADIWLRERGKVEGSKEVERVQVDGKPSLGRWKIFKPS